MGKEKKKKSLSVHDSSSSEKLMYSKKETI